MKGVSLHIGLNFVNPNAYDGWDGQLKGCINDANAMEQIARTQGFEPAKLIDGQATTSAVVSKIAEIARRLVSGDIFLLTYSGHGGQLPDPTGEEDDGYNETWVLYDRELLDNELYALWSKFAAGVRIFVSSDSCHSGTVVRAMLRKQKKARGKKFDVDAFKRSLPGSLTKRATPVIVMTDVTKSNKKRVIPVTVSIDSYRKREPEYLYASSMAGPKRSNPITAQLIFISGCQDNQPSSDGDVNGLFTEKLLQVWNGGLFAGKYKSFHDDILALMPSDQTPNFMTLGNPTTAFLNEKPYVIQNGSSGNTAAVSESDSSEPSQVSSKPSISGPKTWGRNNAAPTLTVNKGVNPYYYIEIASEPKLFDSNAYGNSRTSDSFYGTWDDSTVSHRLTSSSFTIPTAVWSRMKQNSKLYFLVGTTSSADETQWDNYMISTELDALDQLPTIQIISSDSNETQTDNGSEETTDNRMITASVGVSGVNKAIDVKLIQQLLNQVSVDSGGPDSKLTEDGKMGPKTVTAIENFQEYQGIEVDGVISPNGPTFSALSRERSMHVAHA